MFPFAGSWRVPWHPTPSLLAERERSRRADMRWPVAGDGRRSVASFGARADAVGGSHSTGCREPFYARQSGAGGLRACSCCCVGTA